MNLRDRLARMEARARRSAEMVDENFARAWEAAQDFDERIAQVERNTTRIEKLEHDMAAVLAALPKLKGL